MTRRTMFLLLLAAPSLGFTDCSDFDTTTANTETDTIPPIMAARVWIDGVEQLNLGWTDEVTLTGDILVVPAVYDSGGAGTLSLSQSVIVECENGGIFSPPLEFPMRIDSQSCSNGAQVSNGIYLVGDVFDLSSNTFAAMCPAGLDVGTVFYTFLAHGSDCRGNQDTFSGLITWSP